jgi:hypothetical protein
MWSLLDEGLAFTILVVVLERNQCRQAISLSPAVIHTLCTVAQMVFVIAKKLSAQLLTPCCLNRLTHVQARSNMPPVKPRTQLERPQFAIRIEYSRFDSPTTRHSSTRKAVARTRHGMPHQLALLKPGAESESPTAIQGKAWAGLRKCWSSHNSGLKPSADLPQFRKSCKFADCLASIFVHAVT